MSRLLPSLSLSLLLVACAGRRMSTGDGGPGFDAGPGSDAGMMMHGDSSMPPVDGGPLSPLVDPSCRDGMYTETGPDLTGSLSGIAFTGDIPGFVHAVLPRRYPFGDSQVAAGEMNTSFGDCAVIFAGSPTSAADIYRSLNTIVHECGHLEDNLRSPGGGNAYVINPTLTIMCTRGDATDRGGDTFARSRLNNDTYSHLRPPCPGGTPAPGCDFYANTYLDGNPDDTTFQGGDQGFNMVLEEAVQYVNSLVTDYAYQDQLGGGSMSDRDGILTFTWYIERYLHYARTNYPAAYSRLSTDMCWRDAILTVWGRAWLYLERTRGMSSLGIDDAAIEALVMDPALLDEIQRLRTLDGC